MSSGMSLRSRSGSPSPTRGTRKNRRRRRRSSSVSSCSTACYGRNIRRSKWDSSFSDDDRSSASPGVDKSGVLELNKDAETELMSKRKRAMALGTFKHICRGNYEGGVAVEDSDAFKGYLTKPTAKIRYLKRPPGYEKSNFPSTRYAKVESSSLTAFPGFGERFNVAWSAPDGEIMIDYAVKLYDFDSIYSLEIDCDCKSPKSPWFSLIDPRIIPTYDGKVNFDGNMFWTVAFFYKHFSTSGIELWDKEIREIAQAERFKRNEYRPRRIPSPAIHSVFQEEHYLDSAQIIPTHSIAGRPEATSTPRINDNLILLTKSNESSQKTVVVDPSLVGNRFTGCVTNWRGNYGFISCHKIGAKVFLHVSDICNQPEASRSNLDLPVGTSVNFQLHRDSYDRYKAIFATLFV